MDQNEDDAAKLSLSQANSTHVPPAANSSGQGQAKKEFSKGPNLIDVSRYSMIKSRIW